MRCSITAERLGISNSVLKDLGKNSSKAQANALNRTIAGMRTDATRLIVPQSGLKRPQVFKSFTLIKASPRSASPSAQVIIRGAPVPIYQFSAKPTAPMTGKTRGGVSFRVGSGRAVYRHAFVGKMVSGHVGVFQRTSGRFMTSNPNRQAIGEMFGPSVPQFAGKETVEPVVLEKAQARFDTNFQQQVRRFLPNK